MRICRVLGMDPTELLEGRKQVKRKNPDLVPLYLVEIGVHYPNILVAGAGLEPATFGL